MVVISNKGFAYHRTCSNPRLVPRPTYSGAREHLVPFSLMARCNVLVLHNEQPIACLLFQWLLGQYNYGSHLQLVQLAI